MIKLLKNKLELNSGNSKKILRFANIKYIKIEWEKFMIDLRLGDCLDLMKDIPNKSVDVTFTSPPYNRVRNDTYEFYNDDKVNYFDFRHCYFGNYCV